MCLELVDNVSSSDLSRPHVPRPSLASRTPGRFPALSAGGVAAELKNMGRRFAANRLSGVLIDPAGSMGERWQIRP